LVALDSNNKFLEKLNKRLASFKRLPDEQHLELERAEILATLLFLGLLNVYL